jgi:hypothetical protein
MMRLVCLPKSFKRGVRLEGEQSLVVSRPEERG